MQVVSAGVLSMDDLVIAVVLSQPFLFFWCFFGQCAKLWCKLEVHA